jgi:hypothetical protein
VTSSRRLLRPIASQTWEKLVAFNREGVADEWAEAGVFAPGIGPDYRPGGLLYIGKSAGPLGSKVGSDYDQRKSVLASTQWMTDKINNSDFWRLVDRFDSTRRSIAWTNVCKMDQKGGARPPTKQWPRMADVHITALSEEISSLKPGALLFVTGRHYKKDIHLLLNRLGFREEPTELDDGWTRLSKAPTGMIAVETRHPQGWFDTRVDAVVDLIRAHKPAVNFVG